ncbi:MAG TPA: Gfo/Idh/MocA family oxidoreductase [Planctomycetota bacterium]
MREMPRRSFLGSGLAAAAGLSVPTGAWLRAAARPRGANQDLRVAVIGLNGRGNDLTHAFAAAEGSRVIALCDVDSAVLERRLGEFEQRHGYRPDGEADARRLFDRADIDAVAIATPNHWHALLTIWACQAGKDVYCEKPVSHNVFEGRKAVEAAAKYGRVVATGTQSRSSQGIQQAIAWLHEGGLGKIEVARGLCYKTRKSLGRVAGPTPIPASVDYDLWCGPADMLPLRRKSLHYDWHWVWNTGNGDIGNQGIHQMDIARWALGAESLSERVLSVGGRFGYVDDGETPNTQFAVHEFPQGRLVFEVRGLYENNGNQQQEGYRGIKIGNVIECEHGWVAMDTARAWAHDSEGALLRTFEAGPDAVRTHVANFLDCVQRRAPQDLANGILGGHLSSALCHTGNISHRVGRITEPEAIKAQFASGFAAKTYARLVEHLAGRGLDLATLEPVLGADLRMDPATERFVGAPMADLLLSRNYRAPFVVPAAV